MTTPKPTTKVPPQFVVSPGQVGPLRAGMTVQEAEAAGLAQYVHNDCDLHWVLTNPDLSGTFERNGEDDIDRIDIGGARYNTAEGIGVGSTVADLRRAYGSRLSRFPVDPESPPPPFALTTEKGSIIFHTDSASDEPVTASSTVAYMSVIPPSTGQEEIVDLTFFTDGDPC